MVDTWKTLGSEEIGDHHIFTMRRLRRQSPRTGAAHTFVVLDAPDWINVIPLTAAGRVVLIRQYRHGTGRITLEIPGGMVDAQDGSPADSARRELMEETGYAADDMIPLGTVEPNPAFLSNRCYTFLATNARWQRPPEFDGSEDISVEEVDLADIRGLIDDGRITHALVVAAFYHYERYLARQQPPAPGEKE